MGSTEKAARLVAMVVCKFGGCLVWSRVCALYYMVALLVPQSPSSTFVLVPLTFVLVP